MYSLALVALVALGSIVWTASLVLAMTGGNWRATWHAARMFALFLAALSSPALLLLGVAFIFR
ncbi:MAG: hypothetical protein RLZZ373_2667 [Pseudomonadota bacterium]|jgi:hypothetical protein